MTTPNERDEIEALIEAAAGAFRPIGNSGETRAHPAFYDLDEAGREAAFEAALSNRALEASLDPEGLSSTAKAVLARLPK
jgi:hypothetical protein